MAKQIIQSITNMCLGGGIKPSLEQRLSTLHKLQFTVKASVLEVLLSLLIVSSKHIDTLVYKTFKNPKKTITKNIHSVPNNQRLLNPGSHRFHTFLRG